jgi:hypothetical protein
LLSRKAGRFLVRFVVLGAAAGILGSYASSASRSHREAPAEPAALEAQVPNRTVKADRLVPPPTRTAALEGASYSLASVASTTEFDRPRGPAATALAYADPKAEPPKPAPKPAASPAAHAKKLSPPPPTPAPFLDDSQIASLKTRLRLTADQVEYWPAVEAALRDVVRTQLHEGRIKQMHSKAGIDVNTPEVQKLVWAAMPLLMRLREDQKHEVRKLARVMGLESVAAQI